MANGLGQDKRAITKPCRNPLPVARSPFITNGIRHAITPPEPVTFAAIKRVATATLWYLSRNNSKLTNTQKKK